MNIHRTLQFILLGTVSVKETSFCLPGVGVCMCWSKMQIWTEDVERGFRSARFTRFITATANISSWSCMSYSFFLSQMKEKNVFPVQNLQNILVRALLVGTSVQMLTISNDETLG